MAKQPHIETTEATLGDPVHRDPVTGEPVRREAVNIRPVHEEKSSTNWGKWLAVLAVVALGAWLVSGLFDTGEEVEVATNTAAPVVVTEEPAAAPVMVDEVEAAPVVTEEAEADDTNVTTTTVPITPVD